MTGNIEQFRRMNAILSKRGKCPKTWWPLITGYFLLLEHKKIKKDD